MSTQQFTRGYHDHSTPQGFQFEFLCDSCGKGRRSTFATNGANVASGLLRTAAGIFGGAFGKAAQVGDLVRDSTRAQARDDAFKAAVQEVLPHFKRCVPCALWNCLPCAVKHGVACAKPAVPAAPTGVCPHCGTAGVSGKFCTNCGKSLAEWTCKKCAKPVSASAKFCPDCGTAKL